MWSLVPISTSINLKFFSNTLQTLPSEPSGSTPCPGHHAWLFVHPPLSLFVWQRSEPAMWSPWQTFAKSLQATSPLAYAMYSKALPCKPSTLSCSFCLSWPCSGRRRSVEHLAGAQSASPSRADRAPPHPKPSQRPRLAFLYRLAQHRRLSLSFSHCLLCRPLRPMSDGHRCPRTRAPCVSCTASASLLTKADFLAAPWPPGHASTVRSQFAIHADGGLN
jgi:hypothetical protein